MGQHTSSAYESGLIRYLVFPNEPLLQKFAKEALSVNSIKVMPIVDFNPDPVSGITQAGEIDMGLVTGIIVVVAVAGLCVVAVATGQYYLPILALI